MGLCKQCKFALDLGGYICVCLQVPNPMVVISCFNWIYLIVRLLIYHEIGTCPTQLNLNCFMRSDESSQSCFSRLGLTSIVIDDLCCWDNGQYSCATFMLLVLLHLITLRQSLCLIILKCSVIWVNRLIRTWPLGNFFVDCRRIEESK